MNADIDELLRLGARATVIETPTSAIKLKAYGLNVEEAKRRAAKAIAYAHKMESPWHSSPSTARART